MKRSLLLFGIFASSFTFAQDCSELFISEYVEGVGNNKALEIYNPTDASIDLSEYMIIRYGNGATSATASNAVQLTGTIGAKDVHVGVLDKQDPNGTGNDVPVWDELAAIADEFYCPDYATSNAWYWNGNDAVVLAKGTVNDINNSQLIDIFGKIGEDPGVAWTSIAPFTGAGDEVTKDHSMIRKTTVLAGETNPIISEFDPLMEYDSIPALIEEQGQTVGNWGSLGAHECDCNSLSTDEVSLDNVTLYPNPTENGTFVVNGIENVETIEVFSTLGESVYTTAIAGNETMIDLGDMKGLYLVRLYGSNGITTTRRVILK
jgi:hypothetical protein